MYSYYYIDAFTTKPFEGNPCAVFPEADGLSDAEMQNLSRETNLPETAFVMKSEQADFKVRYFTPRSEVPFAGHPTIATAYLLAQLGKIKTAGEKTTVQFEFNIGVLPVEVITAGDGSIEVVGMQQQPPEFGVTVEAAELAPLMGLDTEEFIEGVPVQVVSTGVPFLMVALKKLVSVKKAVMDRPKVKALLEKAGVKVMFVFAPEGFTPKGNTFARLMDPDNAGEDPFTGSATGCMGSFLYRYGIVKTGKIICEQGHLLGRPGEGILELDGLPEAIKGVRLYGKAVPSLRGEYEK